MQPIESADHLQLVQLRRRGVRQEQRALPCRSLRNEITSSSTVESPLSRLASRSCRRAFVSRIAPWKALTSRVSVPSSAGHLSGLADDFLPPGP